MKIIQLMAAFAVAGFIVGAAAALVNAPFAALVAVGIAVGGLLWGGSDLPDEAYKQAINSATERK